MTATALLVLVALPALAGQPPDEVQFGGAFSVQWVDDSVWSHCDMGIEVTAKAVGRVAVSCRWEDGPLYKKERQLSQAEVGELRALLRAASPFQGQCWGMDRRGLDHPLVTLQVHDDERIAVLVISGNDSFSGGGRRKLQEKLETIRNSTDARPKR